MDWVKPERKNGHQAYKGGNLRDGIKRRTGMWIQFEKLI